MSDSSIPTISRSPKNIGKNESTMVTLATCDKRMTHTSLNDMNAAHDDDALLKTEHDQSWEQQKSLILSNENGTPDLIPSTTSAFSSESSRSTSITYGVDWSDRARPISHCWFPYKFDDSSIVQPCAYASCANPNSRRHSLFLQCGTCTLITHAHHGNNSQTTDDNSIPSCRPSFVENTACDNLTFDEKYNSSNYDQHFWSYVSVLPTLCVYCKLKSIPKSLLTRPPGRASTAPTSNFNNKDAPAINSFTANSSKKKFQSTSGVVCSWCSRSYHQSCWELCAENGNTKCDYGIFRNIIVRPQWLRYCKEYSSGFQACLPSVSVKNHSESKHFPYTTVIFFVNLYSGGQYGEKIYRQLLRKLNPRQVFLLEDDATIINALNIYSSLPNIRICALGGDGTAAWVLGRLADVFPSKQHPPVSLYPLGTANDLSSILSWGNHYESKHLFSSLIRIPQAQVISIDRWRVDIEQLDVSNSTPQPSRTNFRISRPFQALLNPPKFVRQTDRSSYQNHRALPNTYFINYMSFGLDAAIVLEFHNERMRDPCKFSSPLKNKLMYLNQSCKYLNDFSRSRMWSLHSYVRLICDGEDLTDAIRHCHTLLILNIPAYASGTNPWGNSSLPSSATSSARSSSVSPNDEDVLNRIATSSTNLPDSSSSNYDTYGIITSDKFSVEQVTTPSVRTATSNQFVRQDFSDGKIEVVGLSATRMASLHMGFHGHRITQCTRLRIELNSSMTAQMDGEPFYLPDSVAVNISYAGQGLVLRNETS